MSICINRRVGEISKRMMCGAPKRIGRCPWWRATVCIPWDLVKAIGRALWPFTK